jgi:hypothetical protein
MLQRALRAGFEQGYLQLLLLFHFSGKRQFSAQIVVVRMPLKLMGKPVRLKFRTVHQDNTGFGVRVYLHFVVRLGVHLLKTLQAFTNGFYTFLKRVHFPFLLFSFRSYYMPNPQKVYTDKIRKGAPKSNLEAPCPY